MFHPYDEEQLKMMYHDSLERIVLQLQEELGEAHQRIRELEGGLDDCEISKEWEKLEAVAEAARALRNDCMGDDKFIEEACPLSNTKAWCAEASICQALDKIGGE